jgi:HPt (histidine-containing phosphotransfer) domain-containing protein
MNPGSHRPFAPIDSGALVANRCRDVEYKRSPSLDGSPGTLEHDVSPQVYRELLAAFLSHLSLQRVALYDAVANEDVAWAQEVAHQIKGTALSFGAARLDVLAKRLLDIDVDQRGLLSSLVSEIDAEIVTLQAVGTGAGEL